MTGASLLYAKWFGLIDMLKKQEPELSVSDDPIGETIDDYFQSLRKEDEPTGHYYLDKSDSGLWLIKHSVYEVRYTAGKSKPKAQSVVYHLNNSHRPNVEQPELNVLHICFHYHLKDEKCQFETFDLN